MALTSRLAALILILTVIDSPAGQARSVPDSLRHRIEQLPTKLTQLYRANEENLAGSTRSMTDGLMTISNALLEDAVVLQAFITDQQPDKIRAEIPRDQEAIGRSVYYERHAEGWGGTITSIEAAEARLQHLENLISFSVTQIFEMDQSFNLKNWYAAWRKASKPDR
jgi:hypothetical protein